VSPKSSCTFITNHGAVLALPYQEEQITARTIAALLGITVRSVLRIIRDLENEGYLEVTKHGRLNHYRVNADRPLRRADQKQVAIEPLLTLLRPRSKSK
jgi:predicted ArsR family transcriptional regulator